jgi:hypothetical protein
LARRWGCGLCLLFAAAALATAVYLGVLRGQGPEAVAEQFLALLARGETDAAFGLASPDLRRSKSPALLAFDVEKWGLKGASRPVWDEVRVQGDEATLEGTATAQDGETVIPLLVKLVRTDGEWRVVFVGRVATEAPAGDVDSGAHP